MHGIRQSMVFDHLEWDRILFIVSNNYADVHRRALLRKEKQAVANCRYQNGKCLMLQGLMGRSAEFDTMKKAFIPQGNQCDRIWG
jgi:hypothetical protein